MILVTNSSLLVTHCNQESVGESAVYAGQLQNQTISLSIVYISHFPCDGCEVVTRRYCKGSLVKQ